MSKAQTGTRRVHRSRTLDIEREGSSRSAENAEALDGRLNSPAGLRVLLLVFLGSAAVFSALPLLRYLRGDTIFDYELWYATGKRVLAGDEIFFFRAGKYDFMYPPPCALFLAGAALLGQGGLIFLLVAINSAAWFCSGKLSAILARADQHTTNPLLYLVPSLLVIVYIWSSYHLGQPNLVLLALMLCGFVSLRTKREVVGRRIHCGRCRDQSVSGTCDRLSGLPTLLDGSRQPYRNTCISASDFAWTVPRI
jgi:Glycosyltransferase family 87